MSSPSATLENRMSLNQPSAGTGSVMVGVVFEDGIVLAINMFGNLIYYLDDHLYCCANSTGFDREAMIEVCSKLEDIARSSGHKGVTVVQAVDLIIKLYEQAENTELLLGGEDSTGVHLVALISPGTGSRVNYAALGSGSAAAAEYLNCQWRPGMKLQQAENLARQAIQMGNTNKFAIDVCIVFKRSSEPTLPVEG